MVLLGVCVQLLHKKKTKKKKKKKNAVAFTPFAAHFCALVIREWCLSVVFTTLDHLVIPV